MENKVPDLISRTNYTQIERELNVGHKLGELEIRIKEAWADARCFLIKCFVGYTPVVLAVSGLILFAAQCSLVKEFFTTLTNARIEFTFDSIEKSKVLTRHFSVPFEAVLLIALFIWRFSPAAFLKKNFSSDLIENSSK